MHFLYSTEELVLLNLLESSQNLAALSENLLRDKTVISRSLKKISEKAPVVQKINGRWRLTPMGKELVVAARDASAIQNAILKERRILILGSNREFMTRIVAPGLPSLKKTLHFDQWILKSFETGTEQALLAGHIDVAFDCGRPTSPEIRYKQIINEPLTIVYSKSFYRKFKKELDKGEFDKTPAVLFERLPVKASDSPDIEYSAVFNDLAAAREACLQGQGWLLAPSYAVLREVQAGQLVQNTKLTLPEERYGVWYLRDRKHPESLFSALSEWLKEQNLDI